MPTHCNQPILVTGSHRSGSTWVGQILALSTELGYIHEPFNIDYGWPTGPRFPYWFTYVTDQNAAMYVDGLRRCLAFSYPLVPSVVRTRSPRGLLLAFRKWSEYRTFARQERRPLLKDPLALFSAEWISRMFQAKPVILVRHPAAFVGSLKKADWSHPFDHFLSQPALMDGPLARYREQIEAAVRAPLDVVDQGILMWNIIHSRIHYYQETHEHWLFPRHEDISMNPVDEFGTIFAYCEVDYTDVIRAQIQAFTQVEGNVEYARHEIKRDSRANIKQWKNRLTESEIARIREGTHKVADFFYTEDDW